jgi:NAD(P)-dependent dehydrogenase (short-subunit alcohol dehydrogenase family)
MEIEGAVTVITGGGSGIGRALALEMARGGADLVIADLDENAAHEVAGQVQALGRRALAVVCDVSKEEGIAALGARVERELGPIDIFVSNAGVLLGGTVEQVTDADWAWIMGINFYAHVYAVRHVLPTMLRRNRGHLVHVASAAALISTGTNIPYHVSKAAVLALAEGLAIDLKARGTKVSVSCVCPEVVNTNLPERSFEAGQTGRALDAEERTAHDEVVQAMKLRMAQRGLPAEEAARAIVAGIRDDRFLIYIHERTHDIVVRRAQDREQGIADAVRVLEREQQRMQQFAEQVRQRAF